MAKRVLNSFSGKVPRISPKLLEIFNAQVATNCDLRSGNLQSLLAPTQDTDLSTDVPKTIWKMGSSIIHFPDGEINCVVDGSVDESNNRIFWSDGSFPKWSDDTLWGQGTWYYRLGIKPPSATPTITHNLGSAGTDVQDYVSYVYTMVTTDGHESAPSPATAVDTVYDGEGLTLSGLSTPSSSNNNYQYKRIYRISSGTAGAKYFYLDQISSGSTTYQDWNGVDGLNEVETDSLATEDWDMPPDTLEGLTQAHNGMLVGYVSKKLYISEPYAPYAWPTNYCITLESDIQGIGCFGEYIVVLTENFQHVISGSDPENLIPTNLRYPQKCLSERGIVSTPYGVYYPSPDGLCLCNGDSVNIVTENTLTKAQWNALTPSNIIGVWYDDKYYAFFSGTNDLMIIDTKNGGYVDVEFDTPLDKIYDVYQDTSTDTLYILCHNTAGTNGYLYTYETSTTELDYIWKSKEFVDKVQYTCAKILGETNGVCTFKYYLDGVLKMLKTVQLNKMFRLPSDGYSEVKEIQIEGNDTVDVIIIATSPRELV